MEIYFSCVQYDNSVILQHPEALLDRQSHLNEMAFL